MSDEEDSREEEPMETEENEEEGSDEESSSEEEPEEVIRARVESLVSGRAKRSNAGAKMSALIDNFAALTNTTAEEDVYQTAYGGFNEEDGDDDFNEAEEEADDELDSDFDVEENQEAATEEAGDDDEEGRRKRPKKSAKMAYEVAAARRAQRDKKTPVAKKQKVSVPKKEPETQEKSSSRTRAKPIVVKSEAAEIANEFMQKRSLRVRKPPPSVEDDYEPATKRRKRNRNRATKDDKDDVNKVWTQEELLKEAKETERENLASLMKYQLLELERNEAKKKAKRHTREMPASFIRVTSMTMPDVEEEDDKDTTRKSNEDVISVGPSSRKQERTIVSFSDEAAFMSAFPHLSAKTSPVKKRPMDIKRGSAVCPISNLRARYFDPVTMMPFASSTTFRVLREAYCNQLMLVFGKKKAEAPTSTATGSEETASSEAEKTGPKKEDLEMETWIEWKKKNKQLPSQPTQT